MVQRRANRIITGRTKKTQQRKSELQEDDIVIVYFSDFNRDTLKYVAPRTKIICMDATHNTTDYDLHLVTLMVKDQTGMGCPVAHCICTRENEDVLSCFLNEIRKKVGRIVVDYFMSDCAPAYFNSWCQVMHKSTDDPAPKPAPIKCIWHVIRAWEKALRKHLRGDDKLVQYYMDKLKAMLHTRNATKVNQMIHQFIIDCQIDPNPHVRTFGEYFRSNWAAKADEWALCLRGLEAYTTNMVLESFHNKLKRNPALMNGKHNHRVDVLFSHIQSMEGEMIKRVCLYSDGFSNKQTAENFKCHKLAANKIDGIVVERETGWLVKSFEQDGLDYLVEETDIRCPFEDEACSQSCYLCGACWHKFMCNCEGAVNLHNRSHSCKHVHLVCMKLVGTHINQLTTGQEVAVTSQSATALEVCTEIGENGNASSITDIAESLEGFSISSGLGQVRKRARRSTPLERQPRREPRRVTKRLKKNTFVSVRRKRAKQSTTKYTQLKDRQTHEQHLLRETTQSQPQADRIDGPTLNSPSQALQQQQIAAPSVPFSAYPVMNCNTAMPSLAVQQHQHYVSLPQQQLQIPSISQFQTQPPSNQYMLQVQSPFNQYMFLAQPSSNQPMLQVQTPSSNQNMNQLPRQYSNQHIPRAQSSSNHMFQVQTSYNQNMNPLLQPSSNQFMPRGQPSSNQPMTHLCPPSTIQSMIWSQPSYQYMPPSESPILQSVYIPAYSPPSDQSMIQLQSPSISNMPMGQPSISQHMLQTHSASANQHILQNRPSITNHNGHTTNNYNSTIPYNSNTYLIQPRSSMDGYQQYKD